MVAKLHRHFDIDGKELPSTNIEITEEQAADEAEQKAMAKAGEMINSISNLADAKVFLKKLCLRLFKNGALP